MMHKIVWSLLCLSVAILSCGDRNKPAIKGTFSNTQGEMVYLEELLPNTTFLLDSAKIDPSGNFSLHTRVSELGFYLLRFGSDRNKGLTLLIDSLENVEISGDLNELHQKYQVEGSKGSALLAELMQYSMTKSKVLDSLGQVFQQSQNNPDFANIKAGLDAQYAQLVKDVRENAIAFIDRNPGSLASIFALYQRVGRNLVFDQNSEADLAYFEKADQALMQAHPQSKHVQTLHLRVENMKSQIAQQQTQREMESKLAPGSPAPEITLNDPKGKAISLSSLRGKIVLIDFWASWCRPCRAENPNVVRVYQKYKNKGFEIYAVSLDRNQASWEQAIAADNLTWIHVSDLAFWSSPILKVYGVSSIPSTVLVDKEGNIIARNLRGQALEQKLEEIFG